MNASEPEADTEYSTRRRGSGRPGGPPDAPSRRPFRRASGDPRGASSGPRALLWAGAALLAASEFCPLLHVHTIAAHPRLVHTVQGGPHHGWALLVIAVLAALLALLAGRVGARLSGLMIVLLGAGALAVTLGVDLPDAHATGLVRGGAGLIEAQAHAAVGLYLETVGAVALLLAGLSAAVLGRDA